MIPLGIVASGAVGAPDISVGPTTLLVGSDTSYLRRPHSVWQKPTQCSIWWNSYQNRWDGVIPTTDGTDAHKVFTDLTAATPTIGVQLDTRMTVRADCWWDGPGKKLYVVFGHHNASSFYRLTYNDVTDQYSIDPGFPVTLHADMSVSQLSASSRNHDWPMVLYRTPDGTLWTACAARWKDGATSPRVAVSRSTDDGATWSTPINLDPTTQNGCVTLGHIVEDGVTKIVLMVNWNDEDDVHGWDGYVKAWSIDSGAVSIDPEDWDEEDIPAAKGTEWSDDHASSVSFGNRIYVAYKTTPNDPSDPLIGVMVREPGGTWTSYVALTDGPDAPTRPAIVIDATYGRLILTWGELGSNHRIRYKVVPLNALDDLAAEPAATLMEGTSAGHNFELGANLPRNTLTATSGVLVLACSETENLIYRAEVSL